MRITLVYKLTIRDRRGRIIRRIRRRQARSFVIAFLLHLQGAWDRISINITDIGNVVRSVYFPGSVVENWMNADGPLGDANYGPVVGSGTTAPAPANYKLETQIAHGNGVGQLSHQETAVDDVSIGATTCILRIRRNFNNNSGAPVDIKEIGLYCWSRFAIGAAYFCLIRDVLAATFSVPAGGTAQLEYALTTTV